MTLILYALTFIPMALVTLVIHELGHLLTARALMVKVSGFQIGIGPTILTFYTGHTRVPLRPSSLVPGITPQLPSEGELASVYVSIDDLGQRQNPGRPPPRQLQDANSHPEICPQAFFQQFNATHR